MIRAKHRKMWFRFGLLVVVLCVVLAASPVMAGGPGGGGGCGGGCGGGGCGGGGGGQVAPLSEFEKQALNIAIDEEYYARAVYQKVIDTFGSIGPFYWIIRDERMHINWVANLLAKYGLPIPPDRWSGNIDLEFTSKEQACLVGVDAEAYNAGVYDSMIPQVTHTDIISVFGKLRDVSRYRHLPAFQQWAATYGAAGQ